MQELERDLFREVVAVQAQMNASLVSGSIAGNKKALDIPNGSMDKYVELTLPYIAKKTKIKDNIGIEDKDYWVNFMKEKKKELINGKNK